MLLKSILYSLQYAIQQTLKGLQFDCAPIALRSVGQLAVELLSACKQCTQLAFLTRIRRHCWHTQPRHLRGQEMSVSLPLFTRSRKYNRRRGTSHLVPIAEGSRGVAKRIVTISLSPANAWRLTSERLAALRLITEYFLGRRLSLLIDRRPTDKRAVVKLR
jgi:hypothetical protein